MNRPIPSVGAGTVFYRHSDSLSTHVIPCLRQNGGHLSKQARAGEFAQLTDAETERIERLYAEANFDQVEPGR